MVGRCYLLYYMARHIASNAQPAFENAHYMMKLETNIGIFKEISVQSALLSYHALIHVFNVIYFYGHWPSIMSVRPVPVHHEASGLHDHA